MEVGTTKECLRDMKGSLDNTIVSAYEDYKPCENVVGWP